MFKNPVVNKKYIFLQNVLYQSFTTWNKKMTSNSNQMYFKLIKKQQLNSLNNPNIFPTSGNTRGNNSIEIKKDKNATSVTHNIPNFFNLKNSISEKKNLSNKDILKFLIPKKVSNMIGTSLPYKKSFFCYWLLPFMGFVCCIATIVDYPSLKFNSLNKNFLTNFYLSAEQNISSSNSVIPLTKISYLKSEFNQIKNLNNEYYNNKNSDSFDNLTNELYNFYKKILEENILNQIDDSFNLQIDNQLPLWSCINWVPLETFKRNQAKLQWMWLNSPLKLPFFQNIQSNNPSLFDVKKNSQIPLEVINFKTINNGFQLSFTKDSFFGKRLEKDSYSILNHLKFKNSLKYRKENKSIFPELNKKESKLENPLNKMNFNDKWALFRKNKVSFITFKPIYLTNSSLEFKNIYIEHYSKKLLKNNFSYKNFEGLSNVLVGVKNQTFDLQKNANLDFISMNSGLKNKFIESNNSLNLKSNLSFFLELKEKNYLPNFFSFNNNVSKNPILSYQKASALIDGLIEPNFSNKLDYWITKQCLVNKKNVDINLSAGRNFSTYGFKHNENFNKIEMNDIFSSISRVQNKKINIDYSKLDIEKNSHLLEKTLVFLLRKENSHSKLKESKFLFKSKKIKQSFEDNTKPKIDKLKKDSLYFLIFKSLKTSLNDIMEDKLSLIKEEQFTNKKTKKISLNNLTPILSKLKKHSHYEENLLLKNDSNRPIIKLTHPIWIANLKSNKKMLSQEKSNFQPFNNPSYQKTSKFNSKNKTLIDSLIINKKNKETKSVSINIKNNTEENLLLSFLKTSPMDLNFLDKNETKNLTSKYFKNNNYSHLSKYLNFLSKKIKNFWLDPINSLESNYKRQSLSFHQNPINQKNISSQNNSIKIWPLNKIKRITNYSKEENLKSLESLKNNKNIFMKNIELNSEIFKSSRNINFTFKKDFGLKKTQYKSQLLRLEKIFRSYLSKKNNSDKKIKSKEKNFVKKDNQSFKNEGKKLFSKSSINRLSKNSYLNFKVYKKLKINDSNYKLFLFSPNKSKSFFLKKPNLKTHINNFSKLRDLSYNLSPTLFLKNRSFILRTRSKKLSSKQKNIIKQTKQKLETLNFSNNFIKSKSLLKRSFSAREDQEKRLNLLNKNESKDITLQTVVTSNITPNSTVIGSPGYMSLLEKRKYERKKRRKKKQRKETGRGKKRTRFFPRPTWLRFKLYSKFLKLRHFKKIINKNLTLESRESYSTFNNNQINGLQTLITKDINQNLASEHLKNILLREKIYRNYKQIWTGTTLQKNYLTNSIGSKGEHSLDSKYFPFFANKDFYQISRTVLGDLKRIFWKSYWLRSNLNPYLNRVKNYLNEMKQSTKNWQIYLSLRNVSSSILGLTTSIREIPGRPFLKSSIPMNGEDQNLLIKKDLNDLLDFKNQEISKIKDNLYTSNFNNGYINIKNYVQNCQFANSSSEKWQIAINIAEYQRIMYERIQQTVSNIRENLNLNGQIRARSSKIGRQKLQTPKPIKDFWIKFGKTITLEIPNTSSIEFYGDMSKLKTWWTLNKSNLASFKSINKRKDLWTSQKTREQRKSNKTKKIVYQMIKNLNSILDEKSTISKVSEVSEVLIKSLRTKPFFNRFIIDKPESIKTNLDESFSNLNVTNSNFENSIIFEKLKRSLEISEKKLRKKENKLSYLGLFNKKTNKLGLQKNYLRTLKKELQALPSLNNNSLNSSQNFQSKVAFNKFTSEYNYWWKGEPLAIKIIPPFKNTKSILNTNSLILWTSTFFFHFCALISLISSSEVRGFIKFNTILLSKIFKTYLDIVFSTYQILLNGLKPFHEIKELQFQAKLVERGLDQKSLDQPIKQSSTFQIFLVNLCGPLWSKQRNKTLKETYLKQASTKALLWSSISKNKSFLNLDLNNLKIKERNSTVKLNSVSEIKNISLIKEKKSFKKFSFLKNKENLTTFLNSWPWAFYVGLGINQVNLNIVEKKNFQSSILSQEELKNKLVLKKISKKYDIKSTKELIYLSFLNILTKPLLWFELLNLQKTNFKKLENLRQESVICSNNFKETIEFEETSGLLNNQKNLLSAGRNRLLYPKSLNVIKLLILSFVNITISSSYKGSFSLYTLLIKSLDIFKVILSSIYLFFEKPGELIVDWIAYAFIVDWSSDLTTTTPDALDISMMHSFSKTSRILRPFIIGQSLFTFSPLGITNSLIQRRIWHLYQAIIEQLCQPDTDLIIRQKKGMVFWDIWSELLIDVAEDANINISELTSLKEEQNRLLDKLELYTPSSLSSFKNRSFKNMNKEDFNLLSFEKRNLFINLIRVPFKAESSKSNSKKISRFIKTKLLYLQGNSKLSLNSNKLHQKQTSWSANQFLSYQGKDTELFIDLHPPKSFSHIPSIKYSQSIQQPIGTIICQIFSGIFNQQIAKNILVVGSPGIEKTLLIQAIAGETELKIITDNAHRYAMVFRGVAVGIKLLRDVFEALSLHTPCIFLLEDIHHIGERRPFLISDDENSKATEFGSEKEEIHEKNQVIYQLSKHFVSHYKKPYKGDFSLLIPTNHFCFNLFLGVSSPRTRSYQITPSSPLQFNQTTGDSSDKQFLHSSNEKRNKNQVGNILSSSLQIKSNQLLAPPATSPFSVLILKEEKKLKPKQIVKEMPWSGLPGEQLALISKANYSIRIKIALLADMALSNVSVKLDMITDLLVIIDSVKGNRGFIVFATTHLPYILDPALRRPGRFDETISLPLIPNLFSRWEILKANLKNFTQPSLYSSFPKGSTIDFTNISGIFSPHFQLSKLSDKLVTFNKKIKSQNLTSKTSLLLDKKHKNHAKNLTVTYHLANKQQPLIDPSQIKRYLTIQTSKIKSKHDLTFKEEQMLKNLTPFEKKKYLKLNSLVSMQNFEEIKNKNMNYKKNPPKTFFNVIARTYFYVSRVLTYFSCVEENSIPFDLRISGSQKVNQKFAIPPTDLILFDSNIYLSLYASNQTLKQHLTHLMAGKLGELFAFSNYQSVENNKQFDNNSSKLYMGGNTGLMSLYGIDKTWRSASSLLFSVITKRYLYNKNLITPKLLYFSNYSSLHEAPSPPSSNVLLPLKRYENYRRTFNAEQIKHKANFQGNALHATLELHQQQRLVKRLYKLPIREFFRSEIISDKLTGFGNSAITLSAVEKNITKPTNINWYYRNRILNRHRNYLNTQWWNGQLSEHNAESTFLSDIDWRYTFVESIGDIFIDFPDSDQFYNARNRRWMLTSGAWNNWFNFEKTTLHEIYNQYTLECFTKAYNSLDQYREIIDFYAFTSLNQCMLKDLKEISIINIFKRFS